jgi:hypothetical protein
MQQRPNFIVDPINFTLLKDEVGIGRIVELSAEDASLLAEHIAEHPHTVYAAASGVCLAGQYGVFRRGERQVAIEWVRQETKPQPGEPECNTYRYLFGLTENGKCLGYEVTDSKASDITGQVADHWTTFEEAVKRHFPDET